MHFHPHRLAVLLGLSLLAPSPTSAEPPQQAGPRCEAPVAARGDLLPQIPLEAFVAPEALAEAGAERDVVSLNNSGYNYRPRRIPVADLPAPDRKP